MRSNFKRQVHTRLLTTADLYTNTSGAQSFPLPPLILHPFSSTEDTSVLMESSRASLALQGFLPQQETGTENLEEQMMRGRYAELRMLYYIGKDITRWAEQCAETVNHVWKNQEKTIAPETFVYFLVNHVPPQVRLKLESWGVLDFCSLFRRSMGLHAIFADIPAASSLSVDFLRRYHRHLDQWYEQRLRNAACHLPESGEFTFDLYASGEYTTMLEQSWRGDSDAH